MKKSEKETDELKKHLEIAINVLYYFYEQIKKVDDVGSNNSSSSCSGSGSTKQPLKQKTTRRSEQGEFGKSASNVGTDKRIQRSDKSNDEIAKSRIKS